MKSLYPWQQRQWRRLFSQYQQNRLPHALLLCGPSGLGKGFFAEQFAGLLLCKTPGEMACGSCPGCCLTKANTHPDLLKLVPAEAGKHIKVDQIRELIMTLSQTGQRGGYQVAIINPAEALNKAAANALLKTLEEPEGQVIFLLVSDQPGTLPATITSRCQRITFSAAQDGALPWLKAQLQQNKLESNPDLLFKIAEGAPLRALHLAENNYLKIREQLVTSLYEAGQHKHSMLAEVEKFLKQDLALWLNAFISIIGDIIRLHLDTPADSLINRDMLPLLQFLQQIYSPASAWGLFDKLMEARQFLQNHSVHLNEQLLMESLIVRVKG